jgi:hypothetical protein
MTDKVTGSDSTADVFMHASLDDDDDEDDDHDDDVDYDDDDEDDEDEDEDEDTGSSFDERDDDMDIGFRSNVRGGKSSKKNRNSQSQRQRQTTTTGKTNKEDAIYGVFWDNENDNDSGGRQNYNNKNNSSSSSNNNNNNRSEGKGFSKGSSSRGKNMNDSSVAGGLGAPTFVAAKRPDVTKKTGSAESEMQSQSTPFSQSTSDTMNIGLGTIRTKKTKIGGVKAMTDVSFDNNNKNNDITNLPLGSSVAASAKRTTGLTVEDNNINNNDDKDMYLQNEEQEALRLLQQEQKEADNYFLTLLEKARQQKTKLSQQGRTTRQVPSRLQQPQPQLADQTRPDNNSHIPNNRSREDEPPLLGEIGLGMGIPSSFGGRLGGGGGSMVHDDRYSPTPTTPIVRVDPSVGRWEKHTKGIGSKLLSKMGWTGSGGLGSNRRRQLQRNAAVQPSQQQQQQDDGPSTIDQLTEGLPIYSLLRQPQQHQPKRIGISRPVEVVVRPNNLGLGFGNFKEATQLKSNRQLEAEVRGLDHLPKDEESRKKKNIKRKKLYGEHDQFRGVMDDYSDAHDDSGNENENTISSSAIPSTQALLSQQLWKRRRQQQSQKDHKRNGGGSQNHHRPEVITYQELIRRQQQKQQVSGGGGGGISSFGQPVIIDMRGPNFTANYSMSSSSNNKPANSTTATKADTSVELGEELLYNLSFLLNTYENKIHSTSTFVQSTKRKVESITSDILDLEQRRTMGYERLGKLQKTLDTIDQVKDITDRYSADTDVVHSMKTSEVPIVPATKKGILHPHKQVELLVSDLKDSFTPEERKALQFWSVLAPTLMSPVFQVTIDGWFPLDKKGSNVSSTEIIGAYFDCNPSSTQHDIESRTGQPRKVKKEDNVQEDMAERKTLMESMILTQLVPKIKSSLDSSRWNPVQDDNGLALEIFQYVLDKATDFERYFNNPKGTYETDDDDDDDNNIIINNNGNGNQQVLPSDSGSPMDPNTRSGVDLSLPYKVKSILFVDTIYPKLQMAISQWQPHFTSQTMTKSTKSLKIKDRLDLWVLPWIPYMLDHPELLSALLNDCKRKLKGTLSFLQRKIPSDNEFVSASIDVIKPWQRLYENKTLHRLLSDDTSVILRLARLLRNQPIVVMDDDGHDEDDDNKNNCKKDGDGGDNNTIAKDRNWDGVRLLMRMHGYSLISDRDFLSIMEAEVLTRWAYQIHTALITHCRHHDDRGGSGSGNDMAVPLPEAYKNSTNTITAGDKKIALNYREWKLHILVDPSRTLHSSESHGGCDCHRSVEILRNDHVICSIFYSVLRMIQLSFLLNNNSTNNNHHHHDDDKMEDELDRLKPEIINTNYHAVGARRRLQEEQEKEDPIRIYGSKTFSSSTSTIDEAIARVRLRQKIQKNVIEPTFRQVLEEIATERNIIFQPRMGITNGTKDGKQVFLFGNLPMYMDGDVVFCSTNRGGGTSSRNGWTPVSLDELIRLATSSSSQL